MSTGGLRPIETTTLKDQTNEVHTTNIGTQSYLGRSYDPIMTGARNFRSYDSKLEFPTLGTFFRKPQTLATTLPKVSHNQNPLV